MKIPRGRSFIFAAVIAVGFACAALAQGDATYKAKCAMCHGADGSGGTPAGKAMGARSFRDPDVVKESDADLQDVILKGRKKMPAYQSKLSADDVQNLVKYIRQLQK